MKKITIAIDGHSSCGKSTMAKALARDAGYIYVDSGAMYRAVTLFALRHGMFDETDRIDNVRLEEAMPGIQISFKLDPETRMPQTFLNGENVEEDIRTLKVSSHVSPIAALPFVRAALTRQQQEMGKEKGIVMDGRDIGTAVFPQAELKIFVTASTEVRARRRYDELKSKGKQVDLEEVRKNVEERDYIDTHRETAPLRQAEDAIVLDNSNMTIEEQHRWLLEQLQTRIEKD